MPFEDLFGNGFNIVTLVTVFRKITFLTNLIKVPRCNRLAQYTHLSACIIIIIFPRYIVVMPFQNIGDCIPQHCLPSMANSEWSGWIGADKFYVSVLSLSSICTAICIRRRNDLRNSFLVK